MLVSKDQRTPTDLTSVKLGEEWEVQYWCTRLNATAEEITACVAKVGPRVEDVEKRLREAGKQALKNTGED